MTEFEGYDQTSRSQVTEDRMSARKIHADVPTEAPSFEPIPSEAPVEGAKRVATIMILPWCC